MSSVLKVRNELGDWVDIPAIVGEKGEKGDKGDSGEPGKDGQPGKDGKDGVDGKTPVKGEDYYTEADKVEMVNMVIAALPNGDEVSY